MMVAGSGDNEGKLLQSKPGVFLAGNAKLYQPGVAQTVSRPSTERLGS